MFTGIGKAPGSRSSVKKNRVMKFDAKQSPI